MAVIDKTYHQLLEKIITDGYTYEDPNRKGINRIEIPSYTFRYEFKDGFPAITTKKLHYKNVVTELIWFLRGDTNIKYLVDNGCNIWNKDAYNYFLKNNPTLTKSHSMTDHEVIPFEKDNELHFKLWLGNVVKGNKNFGDLGPVYGKQWRDFDGVDQIKDLIRGLKDKPLGTEHIVNSWNASDLPDMTLPPCHYGFQIVVEPLFCNISSKNLLINKGLPIYGFELHWTQRSVDTFLGLPFHIASYATLALTLEKRLQVIKH